MVQEVSACGAKVKQQIVNDMIRDERAEFLFKEMRMTFDQKKLFNNLYVSQSRAEQHTWSRLLSTRKRAL